MSNSFRTARRLVATPRQRARGRLSVGNDADITVFDPARVIDRATYQQPKQAPEGIPFVLVNGVPVVRKGAVVPNVAPGAAIRRPAAAR